MKGPVKEEVSGVDKEQLNALTVPELGSTEIFTTHPREAANETLQNLIEFSSFLTKQSFECSSLIEGNRLQASFYEDFNRIIDGVETFTDAISQVKKILRIGILQSVGVLEADLLSILKDLLVSLQSGQVAYSKELLQEHLPRNLEQWRNEGLPAIIRSRDS